LGSSVKKVRGTRVIKQVFGKERIGHDEGENPEIDESKVNREKMV